MHIYIYTYKHIYIIYIECSCSHLLTSTAPTQKKNHFNATLKPQGLCPKDLYLFIFCTPAHALRFPNVHLFFLFPTSFPCDTAGAHTRVWCARGPPRPHTRRIQLPPIPQQRHTPSTGVRFFLIFPPVFSPPLPSSRPPPRVRHVTVFFPSLSPQDVSRSGGGPTVCCVLASAASAYLSGLVLLHQ